MTSTCFWSQSDVAAVGDLQAWSEQKLIASAKGGESSLFEQLCERHMKRVFCVTRRIMPNREDAEDTVQDCFLNAFVHLKDLDGRSQFATWLTRIAINVALMKLRKNRWAREVPIEESRNLAVAEVLRRADFITSTHNTIAIVCGAACS